MTAAERLEWERRELLRAERHQRFAENMRSAEMLAQERASRLLEAQLKRERQAELEFAI